MYPQANLHTIRKYARFHQSITTAVPEIEIMIMHYKSGTKVLIFLNYANYFIRK